jgi:hypothetical protein
MGPFCSPMDKYYWPVPTDGTLRIGDAVLGPSNTFTPTAPLPDFGPMLGTESSGNPAQHERTTTTTLESGVQMREPHSDDKFFGFGSTRKTGGEIHTVNTDQFSTEGKDETGLWSRYEPFRFAVEFWGVDRLGEKERLYSTTRFHAGE